MFKLPKFEVDIPVIPKPPKLCLLERDVTMANMYVLCLKNLMKWFFAMDHYHYARWLSVHLFYLVNLHLNCPDVYNAF